MRRAQLGAPHVFDLKLTIARLQQPPCERTA
jgi:hypothetical protein